MRFIANIYKELIIIIIMKKGLSKKTVVLLVIIAIAFAVFSVAYTQFGLGEKVSTTAPASSESGLGEVGINILPPITDDKTVTGNENG